MKGRYLLGVLAASTLAISGCKTVPPAYLSATPEELAASDKFRLERKNNLLPIEDKVSYLENLIEGDLIEVGEGKLLPVGIYTDGRQHLRIEQNAALLSALSFKYAVTQDEETKALAQDILEGIVEMDKVDGYDGYVPYAIDGKTLQPLREPHANDYSQLLFSYTIMDKMMGRQPLIEEHVSKIYDKWLGDDFELKDLGGKEVESANLSGILLNFNFSRGLDRRLLDQTAYVLGDTQTKALSSENSWKGKIHVPSVLNLSQWRIPTHSSTWLNMIKMSALSNLGSNHDDKLLEITQEYSMMENPFFQTLALLTQPDVDTSFIEARLKEFPVPVNGERIINSHRKDIEFRTKRVIKKTIRTESAKPLPLYELSSDNYLWKRNLLQIDRSGGGNIEEFYGVDFLQAYWMWEFAKMKNQNSPVK